MSVVDVLKLRLKTKTFVKMSLVDVFITVNIMFLLFSVLY